MSKRKADELGRQAYQLARAAYFLTTAFEQGRLKVTAEQLTRITKDGRRHLRNIRGTREWPVCEMALTQTNCDKRKRPAMDIHHRAGRGPQLLNAELFVACCRACHSYVEHNREWAYQEGWLVKRNSLAGEEVSEDSGEDHPEEAWNVPATSNEE